MKTGFLDDPILVSPDHSWRANRYKFPEADLLVSPRAIYILLGTKTTGSNDEWIQFDFVLLDHNCELVGIPWGAYKSSPTSMEYEKFVRTFRKII